MTTPTVPRPDLDEREEERVACERCGNLDPSDGAEDACPDCIREVNS